MSSKFKITSRLLRGGLWATTGKIVFTLGTLAWNSLLTRVLTETEVGAFYMIASLVIFGELVVLGGLNQAVMRLIAANSTAKSCVRAVIKGSAIQLIIFIIAGGLVYYLFIGPLLGRQIFHSRLIGDLAGLTALWFSLRAIQTFCAFILRGFHRVGEAAFVEGAFTALFISLALLYLLVCQKNVNVSDVLILVIGALVCNVIIALYLVSGSYKKTTYEKGISIKEPIRIGVPLSVLALSGIGMNEAHIWIAGAFVSYTDVAVYGAASRLAKFVQMPMFIMNGVISSTIAQLSAKKNSVKVEKILQTMAAVTALPSIFITVIVFVFSGQILSLVFGDFYSAGSEVLVVLVFGQVLNVLVGSPGVLMAMSDCQKTLMVFGVCTGVTGIVLSLVLVGTHGILGVAIGAVTGKILQSILLWAYCLKYLEIKTHPSMTALFNIRSTLFKK